MKKNILIITLAGIAGFLFANKFTSDVIYLIIMTIISMAFGSLFCTGIEVLDDKEINDDKVELHANWGFDKRIEDKY
jgi:hypothetical protein